MPASSDSAESHTRLPGRNPHLATGQTSTVVGSGGEAMASQGFEERVRTCQQLGVLPSNHGDRPSEEFLERRWEQFRSAG